MMAHGKRVALIHALEASIAPARTAFARRWPEAECFDLLDTSLAPDLAAAGELTRAISGRIESLARYAAASEGRCGATAGILFTCSAFGPAIDAAKRILSIPVLRPNEALFSRAVLEGRRIGMLVSFAPSLAGLDEEMRLAAQAADQNISVFSAHAAGALEALQSGDSEGHDRLVAEAACRLPDVDLIILGQFSMARAAQKVAGATGRPVLTTPECGVDALRSLTNTGLKEYSACKSWRSTT